jgi:hypothetical protein
LNDTIEDGDTAEISSISDQNIMEEIVGAPNNFENDSLNDISNVNDLDISESILLEEQFEATPETIPEVIEHQVKQQTDDAREVEVTHAYN